MKRQVMWSQWSKLGLEHLHLTNRGAVIVADGIILCVENDAAFRLRYEVRCDSQWRVRKVKVDLLDDPQGISLTANGEGHWSDEFGKSISMLDGCLDEESPERTAAELIRFLS